MTSLAHESAVINLVSTYSLRRTGFKRSVIAAARMEEESRPTGGFSKEGAAWLRDGISWVPDAYKILHYPYLQVWCFEVENNHRLIGSTDKVERMLSGWWSLDYFYWTLRLFVAPLEGKVSEICLPALESIRLQEKAKRYSDIIDWSGVTLEVPGGRIPPPSWSAMPTLGGHLPNGPEPAAPAHDQNRRDA